MAFLAPLLGGGGAAAGAASAAPSLLGSSTLGQMGNAAMAQPQQPAMPALFGGMQLQGQASSPGQDVNGLYNFFSQLAKPAQPTETQAVQAKVGGFRPQ